MPNGFYGSEEEWERMEAPFRPLDPELDRFAGEHGLAVIRSYHNHPVRYLQWGGPMTRRIGIHRVQGGDLAVGILVWEDRDLARYMREETLAQGPPEEIRAALPETLERARREVETWRPEDLELAVRLGERGPLRSLLEQAGGWGLALILYALPLLLVAYLALRLLSCGEG